MNIQQNVSLKDHSTMRLGGNAAYYVEVGDRNELQEAMSWAEQKSLPTIVVGGGSNIVWKDEDYPGLVIANRITGFQIQPGSDHSYLVTAGGGEDWDKTVARTVEQGLTGIECMSLIPGTTGAMPVQNAGAYGCEIADVLVSLEAYDKQTKEFVTIPAKDCAFSYRDSRFKTGSDRGRYIVTSVTMRLMQGLPQPPFYKLLQAYLDERQIAEPTPQIIRDAVIDIRKSRLPDPAKVASNGSFFANPIVENKVFDDLKSSYPEIPGWPTEDEHVKIPAAWLIEQAGFKDYHDPETGMGTWPSQPLILINENAQSTAQLIKFKQKIIDAVRQKFGITLVQEPELLP